MTYQLIDGYRIERRRLLSNVKCERDLHARGFGKDKAFPMYKSTQLDMLGLRRNWKHEIKASYDENNHLPH